MTEKLKNLLETLTEEEKDVLYRHLWTEHVKTDIQDRLLDLEETLTDTQLDYAANQYVNGNYNCTVSYWENIDTNIDLALQRKK